MKKRVVLGALLVGLNFLQMPLHAGKRLCRQPSGSELHEYQVEVMQNGVSLGKFTVPSLDDCFAKSSTSLLEHLHGAGVEMVKCSFFLTIMAAREIVRLRIIPTMWNLLFNRIPFLDDTQSKTESIDPDVWAYALKMDENELVSEKETADVMVFLQSTFPDRCVTQKTLMNDLTDYLEYCIELHRKLHDES